MTGLNSLKKLDRFKQINTLGCKTYIHRDHRYCLVPAFYQKLIDTDFKPLTLIGFDFHHDTIIPSNENLDEIKSIKLNPKMDNFIKFVNKKLKQNDDDWIIAGMELGLIDNAIIFGVHQPVSQVPPEYTDSNGSKHYLYLNESTPGEMFGYQGNLSDISRESYLKNFWDLLGWSLNPSKLFDFNNQDKKYWLNIDLDCFIIEWEGFTLPWEEEIFEKRFEKDDSYGAALGWTGLRFVQEVIKRSNLITIATEPTCCGGQIKSNRIRSMVNNYLFSGKIGS